MESINKEAITAIVDLALKGTVPQAVPGGNIPYALEVLPGGGTHVRPLTDLIFNEHSAKPDRIKTNVAVGDVHSFLDYWTLFSDPNSRVFADENTSQIRAILDYHGAGEGSPRWGSHVLVLAPKLSEEWTAWTGKNSQPFTQQAFAEFLEQNCMDVTTPSPADMVEIANDLQATTQIEFGSSQRQSSGQVQLKYVETVRATTGSNVIDVPERFKISIPVFVGGDKVPMEAFLRFRPKDGKVTFHYTLIRPYEVKRAAFQAMSAAVQGGVGDSKIINGEAVNR
jgi:uncharacterized protein YfdQ (DUF2303 family)